LPGTDYTVANHALVYKTTADSVGRGEVHTVKSVVAGASGYVELTTNLQHTYVGTSCKCIRLLASVDDITTNAGGAGGDSLSLVHVQKEQLLKVVLYKIINKKRAEFNSALFLLIVYFRPHLESSSQLFQLLFLYYVFSGLFNLSSLILLCISQSTYQV
jgi:hypothetical protein